MENVHNNCISSCCARRGPNNSYSYRAGVMLADRVVKNVYYPVCGDEV